jgi:YebC/PmpR family DNA-binding regulatory protein
MIDITVEKALKMFMEYTHYNVDGRLVKRYFEQSAETIEWLEDMGVEFEGAYKDFTKSEATWHIVKTDQGIGPRAASFMNKALYATAQELGVTFMLETAGKKILKDDEGKVCGVVAVDKSGKEITIAVKEGGGEPASNSKLRDLIQKAKANNVPNDNIERCIKKALGSTGESYEEVSYEGYGPAGVAVIVTATTDNRNRTAGNVRAYFSKYHGNMGQTGCVGYLFTDVGEIVINNEDGDVDEDKLMEQALEAGAADFKAEGDVFVITTEPDDVYSIQEDLKNAGYEILSAEKTKQASTSVTLESEDDIKFMNLLIEKLEDDDDVMDVYHNWENCDD